jgi:hypothetical protein
MKYVLHVTYEQQYMGGYPYYKKHDWSKSNFTMMCDDKTHAETQARTWLEKEKCCVTDYNFRNVEVIIAEVSSPVRVSLPATPLVSTPISFK